MTEVLSQSAIDALARTLAHFVWQGAAIGLIALIAFRAFRSSASARYLTGVLGLGAMLVAPVLTFFIVANSSVTMPASVPPSPQKASAELLAEVAGGTVPSAASGDVNWMTLAVLAWMVGAIGFMFRLAGGWVIARRYVTRAIEPASEEIVLLAQDLADRMGIRHAIAVVQSTAVVVPVMVGWLKPTVVLPIAALSNLTPAQVEALIAHELAHVRRYDYLVNLLQSTVEALLFYHPAVWWLSRRVRADRELCCDDLAVSVCDRLVYATALTDLATLTASGVALAATDGDLLGRVRRILGRGESSNLSRPGAIPLMAIAIVASLLVPVAFASVTQQHPVTTAHVAIDTKTDDAIHQQATASPKPTAQTQAEKERELVQKHMELTQKLTEQQRDELKKHLEQMQTAIGQMKHVELNEKIHQDVAKSLEKAKVDHELKMKELSVKLADANLEVHLKDAVKQIEHAKVLKETQGQELASQLERIRALYEKGLVSQSQLEEARARLTIARETTDANREEMRLRAQLRDAEVALERTRSLVEKGLMASSSIAPLEQAVVDIKKSMAAMTETLHAQQQPTQGQVRHNLTQAETRDYLNELAARQAAAQPQTMTFYLKSADPLEIARVVNEMLASAPSAPTVAANKANKTITVTGSEQVLALVKNIIATTDRSRTDPLPGVDTLTEAALVQAGDIVNVTITGEPRLGGVRVGQDGTIQLPFMGSIKVSGLNTAQVREAVGKRLVEKKLGTVDRVSITVTRAK